MEGDFGVKIEDCARRFNLVANFIANDSRLSDDRYNVTRSFSSPPNYCNNGYLFLGVKVRCAVWIRA